MKWIAQLEIKIYHSIYRFDFAYNKVIEKEETKREKKGGREKNRP